MHYLCNIALLLICLTGCGYHSGQGSLFSSYQTIAVPYVKGDWDGSLTATIVKEISQNSSLTYVHDCGSLILSVQIVDIDDENIGFRYDRSKHDEVKKAIIPSETRLIETVEVSVIESASGKVVLGPALLSAYTDFDHDYYTVRGRVNIFSLGQVTDYDEAEDAAQKPLHACLARKIVDYINNSW